LREAILTATYLINRLPSKLLNLQSPMQVLSSFYPQIESSNKLQPRIFGCIAFVHVHNNERGRLDPRAVKCVFVGYSNTQKGYRCYHPISRKIYVSRDVTFHEQESYFKESHLQGHSITKEDEPLREDKLLIFSRP